MSVGVIVKTAREAQGVSISDLAVATKIRESMLLSLEADDFACFGGTVYVRGHLKVIAAYLNLDPFELSNEFAVKYADSA